MAKLPKEMPESVPAPPLPTVEVIERRIREGGRVQMRPLDIRLTGQTEPQTVRVINTAQNGRFWQVTQDLGWVPVRPSEIAGGLPQGDLREQNGQVVLGEGGREVVVKMPTALHHRLGKAKADSLTRKLTNRAAMMSRAQHELGAEGKDGERIADRMAALSIDKMNVYTEREVAEPGS